MSERAVVVGGGISGLAAARSLALRGYRVTLIEAQDQPGGLASGVEIDGQPIERSYH